MSALKGLFILPTWSSGSVRGVWIENVKVLETAPQGNFDGIKCSRIDGFVIEDCLLVNAGQRPFQAGGSTGLGFCRPPGAKFEARPITIRRNVIYAVVQAHRYRWPPAAIVRREFPLVHIREASQVGCLML